MSCDDLHLRYEDFSRLQFIVKYLLFCIDESLGNVSLFFGISILPPTLQCLCNFLSLCSEKSNCYRLQSATKTTRRLYCHARV